MQRFDIAPFVLPRCAPGEYRFELPRDIQEIRTWFPAPPEGVRLFYLRDKWPVAMRYEEEADRENPARFGWAAHGRLVQSHLAAGGCL